MSKHSNLNLDQDQLRLVGRPRWIATGLTIVGMAILAIGFALGCGQHDHHCRFMTSYLVSYMFFLSISLGALFFVAIQHLVRAGWSVTVRRMAEILAVNVIYLAILFLPILVPLLLGQSGPYFKWLDPEQLAEEHLSHQKMFYLNLPFFTARAVFYFLTWGLFAWFFFRQSTRQDTTGDPKMTRRMEKVAPWALLLFSLTITFASFDWLMTIEPAWFSTIFGAYYFAGCAVAIFSVLILFAIFLQWQGMAMHVITVEHYHELGKLLLGFVVFWGYMAFSQYMLIWYANIPEETVWYLVRQTGSWTWVSLGLLFGHLLIPFLCLLPRKVKRRKIALGFWAVWLLAFHWLDIQWLVMPTFSPERMPFGWIDVCCFAAIGCVFMAGVVWTARNCSLIPTNDPRLGESLSFEN